jgi:hypothetical protein
MIELSADEIRLLRSAVSLPVALRERLSAAREDPVVVGDEEQDLLLELVTDRLMTHGFDNSYRPTAEGKALELLVDRLSPRRHD